MFSLKDYVITEDVAESLLDKINVNNPNLSFELERTLKDKLSVTQLNTLSYFILAFNDISISGENDVTGRLLVEVFAPILIEDMGKLTVEDKEKVV